MQLKSFLSLAAIACGIMVGLVPGCGDEPVEVTQTTGTSTTSTAMGGGGTAGTGGTSSGGSGGVQMQCETAGAACDAAIDCCSLHCTAGKCDDSVLGCTQLGDK